MAYLAALEEGQSEPRENVGEWVPGGLGPGRRGRTLGHGTLGTNRQLGWWPLELGLLGKLGWRLDKLWPLLWRRRGRGGRGGELGQARQTVNVDRVGSLVSFVTDVHALLRGYQIDQLVAVLANNYRSEVASDVMPLDSLAVLVVEDGQTGLVMELLQPLDGDPNVVICRDRPLINALKVVRLRSSLLSAGRPEGVRVGLVGGRDPAITGSRPEPSVDINRLEVSAVTALVLEVALSAGGVDRGNIVSGHDLLKHFEFSGSVERDEVHAAVSAEVTPVEPIPILKLVPGFPPTEEVVMVAHLHVTFPLHTLINVRPVEQGLAVRSNPGGFLGERTAQEGEQCLTLHLSVSFGSRPVATT